MPCVVPPPRPARPSLAGRAPFGIAGFFPKQGESEHRRGGVHVEGRQAFGKLLIIPILEEGVRPHLPFAARVGQCRKPNPLRPFPAIKADVIPRRAIKVRLVKATISAQAAKPATILAIFC